MKQALEVPYGMGPDGRLVPPGDAARDGSWRCPSCEQDLVLHRGPVRVPHFAHKVEGACSQESILHDTAKRLLAQVVADWKAGGEPPVVSGRCGSENCEQPATRRPLPARFTSAEIERPLPASVHGAVLRPDVSLMVGATAVAAVEILHTHEVSGEKRIAFAERQVRWIELAAEAVLRNPLRWFAVNNGRPEALRCEECREREAAITRLSREYRLPPLPPEYRRGLMKCYGCKREILVFSWPDHEPFGQDAPPGPTPGTVQLRFSQTAGFRYWANVCPSCNRVQGDHYLYLEPNGPFYEEPALVTVTEIDDSNRAAIYARMGPRIDFH